MNVLITDPDLATRLIAERQRCDGDRFDEVWDGVYIMMPLADNQHQELQARVGTIMYAIQGWPADEACRVYLGVNVSNLAAGWENNYRCPDIAVFLRGNQGKDCRTHWFGGPDFAVEIVSVGDRSRGKLAFYASVGVRELLIIDRDPWALELYRLIDQELRSVARVAASDVNVEAQSEVLPVSFRFQAGEKRPGIEIIHRKTRQRWVA